VVAGGEGCDQGCQDVLINSRQIHMLLGKSSGRLERIYLPSSADLEIIDTEELQAVHPYLLIHAIENQTTEQACYRAPPRTGICVIPATLWSRQITRRFYFIPNSRMAVDC